MEPAGGCNMNGIRHFMAQKQNRYNGTVDMESERRYTRNGTCYSRSWKQNDTADMKPAGGSTMIKTSGPLMSEKRNWQLNVEPSRGCTPNKTSILKSRKQNSYFVSTSTEFEGGCNMNKTCSLMSKKQNCQVGTTIVETTGECMMKKTCPLEPQKRNRQFGAANVEPARGCTLNGTRPLKPRNQNCYFGSTNIEPEGGCIMDKTCPLMSEKQNRQVDILIVESAGECPANGTCPSLPLKEHRQFHKINMKCAEGCTLNRKCFLKQHKQNRYSNAADLPRKFDGRYNCKLKSEKQYSQLGIADVSLPERCNAYFPCAKCQILRRHQCATSTKPVRKNKEYGIFNYVPLNQYHDEDNMELARECGTCISTSRYTNAYKGPSKRPLQYEIMATRHAM